MDLTQRFEQTGGMLFRYRSYIPLITLPIFYLALHGSGYAFGSPASHLLWVTVCLAISAVGVAIRVATVGTAAAGTSGRNTRVQMADELNTGGIYSLVRHPLYVGNFVIFLGVSLYPGLWWVLVLNTLLFWLYYFPIMFAEEAFLRGKFGDRFREWSQRTPAVVPSLRHWQPARRPYYLRKALRREYQSTFATIVYFALLELMAQHAISGSLMLEPYFQWLLGVGLVCYLTMLVLCKTTRLFEVPDRVG